MPLVIDFTVSNVIKQKRGKPTARSKAHSREVSKSAKYQELCHGVGMSFRPVVFESQGLARKRFFEHFDKLIVRRAGEIGVLHKQST
jgi:hypothetical protein